MEEGVIDEVNMRKRNLDARLSSQGHSIDAHVRESRRFFIDDLHEVFPYVW
jgi:hypothetical protein